MPNQAVTVFGIVTIILLLFVTYAYVSPRLAEADVQSLFWGQMLADTFPIWLTAFGVLFSVVLIASNAQGVTSQK